MIKQISILLNIKYTICVLLLSLVLVKNDSFAQYYQYPIIDSVAVIPEYPVASVDIVKVINYTNHIRSNCQLVSKLWSWATNDNRFVLNLNYTTNTNSINCMSIDTASLASPPEGTYDLIVAVKVYSSLDTIVDTLVTSFVMIEDGLNLNQEVDFERLTIYPNPATNELNFTLKDNSNTIQLEVFDITGKKVKTEHFSNQEKGEFKKSIDISDLKSGLYFCKFKSGDKQVMRKFIKH